MRKIILQEFVTIDGFAADPNGKMDFVQDYAARQDESFQKDAERFLDTLDTMILGANTYKMFVEYWPEATEEGAFARKLNSLSKYVVSSTIESAPWGDWEGAEIIGNSPDKKITTLKQKPGKDMVVWGSISLAQSLMKKEIVDEIQLRVCPTVLGSGKRLFANNFPMELLEAKAYDEGLVLLRYKPN
jgi:dihydrofolate reductase